jgi:hypothetical protein
MQPPPPPQILGSKPIRWDLDNTRHNLRQSLIIIIRRKEEEEEEEEEGEEEASVSSDFSA